MKQEPYKLIIADDHAVVRTGLQFILDETNDLRIVDEARNGQELLDKLQEYSYDMVILDISMPGRDALDVLKEIKSKWPLLHVIIFSMSINEIYAVRMLSNGASAFINKETKPAQIIDILRIVVNGVNIYLRNRQKYYPIIFLILRNMQFHHIIYLLTVNFKFFACC